MKFVEVNGTSDLFAVVEDQFRQVIQPIYGTHPRLLDEIKNSSTARKCLLLLATNDEPVGILVFKNDVTEEREGSKYPAGCFVIKTMFVINNDVNKGKGYGSCLMEKAISEATDRQATSMYATVSESAPDALKFFQKKGCQIVKEMKDKFKPGVTEYVLIKTLNPKCA